MPGEKEVYKEKPLQEEPIFTSPLPLQSEEIGELVKALSAVQGKLKNPSKDKTNPFYHSKYADLTAVWDSCRKELSSHGLAVFQTTLPGDNGYIKIVTTLAHSSGQWVRGILNMRPEKNTPQGIGSAITYARRYALSAIVGIASEGEDDDGEAAEGRPQPQRKPVGSKPLKSRPSKSPTTHQRKTSTPSTPEQQERIWQGLQEYSSLVNKPIQEVTRDFLKWTGKTHIEDLSYKQAERIWDNLVKALSKLREEGEDEVIIQVGKEEG